VFDVIGKRRWFYLISLAFTIPGLVFILLTPFTDAGLQFTIDYTGGTKWEVRFEDPAVTPDQVEAVFAERGLEATAVTTGSGFIEIKTEKVAGFEDATPTSAPSASPSPDPSASPAASASADPSASPSPTTPPATGNTKIPTEGALGEVATALQDELGPIAEQRSLTTIGAVVSSDLISQALVLILVGSIGILAWITYRFRDVKFGFTALVALLHDVIVVIGAFAILGTFLHVEIDALFVTAMLTVIGFSVHDTIVVFDRIRENKARHAGEPFAAIVNHSILQTFGRSIMTSLTVVLTLLALLLFGGAAISDFVLALLLGIISGTYSSIFVASPLLVDWQLWDDRRHGRLVTARAPRVRHTAA
jgi:preprotein translocase subunit SecF